MLKFWKKTGRKEASVTFGSSSSSPTLTPRSQTCNGGGFFPSENLTNQMKDLEELIKEDTKEVVSSRLSKTLAEVIGDNEAFPYFIQYLETIGQGAMIKFILDVESFNSAITNANPNLKVHSNGNSRIGNLVIDECKKRFLSGEPSDMNRNDDGDRNDDNNGGENGCDDNGIPTDNSNQCIIREVNGVGDGLDCDDYDQEQATEERKLMARLLNSSDDSDSLADAVKIFNKFFSHKAPLKISLDPGVRKRLLVNLNSSINPLTFSEVKDYILKVMEKEHFNDYLKSDCHCKYQIDVLTSKKITIADILFNETALFYFMEFLEQEGATNLLEFWLSALYFQQEYEEQGANYNVKQAQKDAMVLYEKYFSLQASTPLHLGDDIRIKVEESICREDGPLPNCFEHPRRLIVKLVELNYFEPFLQSQLYFKYLSELISSVQTSPVLGHRSRLSGGDSDGSSDISISVTNTLLASEDTNPSRKMYKHLSCSSLTIDAQQLYDPDSLWQRRSKKSGLNFGRVNELGRFETDLEPEPDRKEESRITKAVKKLVNLNEDKSKEELAWQVAAMIVRDVTNITMPSSTGS